MRICKSHWQMMRDSVDEQGMGGLVQKDGAAAFDNEMKALDGQKPDFDPLMSHNWHWSSVGMEGGGLAMMSIDMEANPDNEGHFCPFCEWIKNVPEINAREQIDDVSKQMQAHCREIGLIPKAS
jgi:hypothetical protein